MNVKLITDVHDLIRVTHFLENRKEFGLDLETNVVKHFLDRKIRTIQVGDKDEQYVIDLMAFAGSPANLREQGGRKAPEWAKPIVEALQPHLQTDRTTKLGVNLYFEYITLSWCLGVYPFHFYDAQLVEKIIYAGKMHPDSDWFSMENMLLRYTNRQIDKSLQTSFDLDSPSLSDDQVLYAALDTRLPFVLRHAQMETVKKAGLELTCYIENQAIPAFGDLHTNGILLSAEKWNGVVDRVKARHIENTAALDALFIPVVGRKTDPPPDIAQIEAKWRAEADKEKRAEYRQEFYAVRREAKAREKLISECEGEALVNYGSSSQLLPLLRQMGKFSTKELPSTDDKYLKLLKTRHPVIKALQDFRETEKILDTYAPYVDGIRPETGRMHPDFQQMGAATGRTSCRNKNVQNIPKGEEWRNCYVARPGYVMITVDYSGCELRILAELSGEQAWVDAFNADWDVHSVGAEIIFGEEWKQAAEPGCAYYERHAKCSCKAHKTLRNHIKAINFGIAYGMMAKKLADDLGISKKEAEDLLIKYRSAFVQVMAYLERSGQDAKMKFEARTIGGRRRLFAQVTWDSARAFLEKDGLPTDPGNVGRKCNTLLSNIEREGKNSPIQGTNADMIKLAMGSGIPEAALLLAKSDDLRPLTSHTFIWRKLRFEYGAELVNMVHDELVIECPQENAEACYHFVGQCMKQAGAVFVKKMVMDYEGHIAPYWTKGE